MKYNTLLFDADGTLLDFKKSERTAIGICLEKFKIPHDAYILSAYSRINDNCWKRLERGEIDKATLRVLRFAEFCKYIGRTDINPEELADAYFEELREQHYIIDGAEEICRNLSRFCRMYIVTNGFKVIQQKRFGESPLAKYFDGCFISEEIGFEKPDKRFFDAVKSKIFDFRTEDTLLIGDSLTSDMRGGCNAGIDTCWYNPAKLPLPDDSEGLNITYTVSSLSELTDIILQ